MSLFKTTLHYSLFTFLSSVAFERGLFVLYLNEKGYTPIQISILQVSLFLASILCEVPTGFFADRMGRKLSLALGTVLMASAIYGQYLSGAHFPFMLAAFILHGISFAFISGSGIALLYDNLHVLGRSDAYLRISTLGRFFCSLALGASMSLGGLLHERSWKHVYGASTVLLLAALVPLFFLNELKAVKVGTRARIKMREVVQHTRPFLPLILPLALMNAAMTPYFIYSQTMFSSLAIGATRISFIIAVSEILGGVVVLLLVSPPIAWRLSRLAPTLLLIFALCLFVNLAKNAPLAIGAFLTSAALVLFIQSLASDYLQGQITDSGLRASILSMMSFVDSAAIALSYLIYGFLFSAFKPCTAVAITAVFPLIAAYSLGRFSALPQLDAS